MSVLLKTGDSLQNATMITIKTAVAVRRAIAKLYDIGVAIKWVNDLYYRGKKVCIYFNYIQLVILKAE